jgi:replication factor A1
MKISDLTNGQGNVSISGIIKEVGEKRSFNKYGRNLTVCHALLEDDSGNVKLTLWNDDADRFKEGDQIKLTNGYVKEFQGEKQLTSGKFGVIEKVSESVEKNEGDGSESAKPSEEAQEDSLKELDESTEEVLY